MYIYFLIFFTNSSCLTEQQHFPFSSPAPFCYSLLLFYSPLHHYTSSYIITSSSSFLTDAVLYQIIGAIVFILWAVLPFVILCAQLCRYRCKGNRKLQQQLDDVPNFRLLFGWSVGRYRTAAEPYYPTPCRCVDGSRKVIEQ